MVDNINLLQELLWQYGKKEVSPRCIIRIDFKKAFDSVEWPFLRHLLMLFGFLARFFHLIIEGVETTSFSVVVNGDLFGFFSRKMWC